MFVTHSGFQRERYSTVYVCYNGSAGMDECRKHFWRPKSWGSVAFSWLPAQNVVDGSWFLLDRLTDVSGMELFSLPAYENLGERCIASWYASLWFNVTTLVFMVYCRAWSEGVSAVAGVDLAMLDYSQPWLREGWACTLHGINYVQSLSYADHLWVPTIPRYFMFPSFSL